MSYRYFKDADFMQASPSCSIEDMEPDFLHRLDVARFHAGVPFRVNSAFRSVDHEIKKGRAGTSSHTTGKAVDIRATGSRERYQIIHGLLTAGFTRIGVASTYIHADYDESKDQHVIWNYK